MLVGKISALNNINRNGRSNMYSVPTFTRRLDEHEMEDYNKNAIRAALDYLGVQSVAMILHGSCNPVIEQDMGIGSPCSSAAKKMIEFENLHGFNANQLGPLGEITRGEISPYSASVFALNKMFIDPQFLTTDEYANILSNEDLSSLRIDYSKIEDVATHSKFFDSFENYDRLLKDAYKNFLLRLNDGNPNALKLEEEYKEFKQKKGDKLLMSALFEVLSNTYGTRDVSVWESEIDRNLPTLLKEGNKEAKERFNQVYKRSSDEINSYLFGQFLINKQLKENKDFREKIGFKYISDNLVGNDVSEEWIYPDVFLKNYRMGCPEGGKNNEPQVWDIPVLNPKMLFNGNGTLGPAGIFLKEKLEAALEYCENIRIDHALGLVDPYVYDKRNVLIIDDALDRSRFYGDNISRIGSLDVEGNYKKILEKIVLPVLQEHGITPEQAVWEDIGSQTPVFWDVYYNKLNLPGMTQLHWSRGEGVSRRNWVLMGSHDEPSSIGYIKDDNNTAHWDSGESAWNKDYLAGYLNSDPNRADERDSYNRFIREYPLERLKAKYAEMFLSGERVQIPFNDFFGIEERYNTKGTKSAKNWKLRLNKNFEDAYYKNLESDVPTAINMPEILKLAVRAKIDRKIIEYTQQYASFPDGSFDANKVDSYRVKVNKEAQPLLDKLDYYSRILKKNTQE